MIYKIKTLYGHHKMVSHKKDKNHSEYIKLHYKLLKLYRIHYPYMPFRYIQKKIHRRWQIMRYINCKQCDTVIANTVTRVKWSEVLEVSQILL
jgi:hypothetical protein